MKSILVIGMGKFGHHLAKKLLELGNEVMVVDNQEEKLADLLPFVTKVKIADCTNLDVIQTLGLKNFDICIVCIGTNFQSSLEITSLLKENGAKYVISKATRDIQAKFLLRNGADQVIYPDRDMAEKLAVRYSMNHIFDYIELDEEHSICEIQTASEWIGKTIGQVDFRARYKVSILGYKVFERTQLMPAVDHVFKAEEHLMVMGKTEDIDALLKQISDCRG